MKPRSWRQFQAMDNFGCARSTRQAENVEIRSADKTRNGSSSLRLLLLKLTNVGTYEHYSSAIDTFKCIGIALANSITF